MPTPEKLVLSPGLGMLCRLALSSSEVREWLREKGTAANLDPQGGLLDQIARAEYADGDPAAVTRFLSTLGEVEERAFSGLDLTRSIADPLPRAMETWAGLEAQKLLQEVEGLKNRLAQPGLSAEERMKMQKVILDLKIRVADVSRPFQ